jgi:O-Antigen ligase
MMSKILKFYAPILHLLPYFIVSSIFIASGQLFHEFKNTNRSEEIQAFSRDQSSGVNLFFSDVLNSLFAFSNDKQNSLQRVTHFSKGFWQISNLKKKGHVLEILTQSKFYIQSGKTYTQSVFVKHDGSNLGLQFSFFSANGHSPAKTTVRRLNNSLYRIFATYIAKPGDIWIRAVDLLVLSEANWNHLSIGFAQLELSSNVTPYQLKQNYSFKPGESFFWWIGIFFVSFIAMIIGYSSSKLVYLLVLRYLSVLILIIYGLISIFQKNNDTLNLKIPFINLIITENANFIAHSSVIISSIILLLEFSIPSVVFLLLTFAITVLFKSYTAIFGALVLLLVWFFKSLKIRKSYIYLTSSVFIFTFIINFQQILNFYPVRSRLEVWRAATEIWLQKPFFGVGISQFSETYIQFRRLNDLDLTVTHAHNIILQLLAESGIFGCALYLIFLFLILRKIYFKKNIALTILATIFAMNMFDFTWFYAWIHIPIWIIIGITFRMRLQKESDLASKGTNLAIV